jgi:hypothetical protein
MKTTTKKHNNNTMQFRPDKVDCTYIKEHSMVNLHSCYFTSGNVKFFNSKIKRVLFVHKEDKSNSNIFSKYGYNPYNIDDLFTILIEEVQAGFNTEEKEYKIVLLSYKVYQYRYNGQVARYKDYKTARNILDRLENGLKLNLDSLRYFH